MLAKPVLTFSLVLSACLALFASSLAGGSLAGSQWGMESAEAPTLHFNNDGTVNGNAGCNRFFGPFVERAGHGLEIGPVGATKMACPGDIMEGENSFFAAMASARTFKRDGDRLHLIDADGATVLTLLRREAE